MSEEYSFNCSCCGILMRVPQMWINARRADGGDIYCPNGHVMSYTESRADKLFQELSRERQRLAQRDDEIKRLREVAEAAERRVAAAKAQVTKLKKRAAGGVCPCCNRTFLALQKHMAQKHPTFTAEDTSSNVVQIKRASP